MIIAAALIVIIIVAVSIYRSNKKKKIQKLKEEKKKSDFHKRMISLVTDSLQELGLSTEYRHLSDRKATGYLPPGPYIPAGKVIKFKKLNLIVSTYDFWPEISINSKTVIGNDTKLKTDIKEFIGQNIL